MLIKHRNPQAPSKLPDTCPFAQCKAHVLSKAPGTVTKVVLLIAAYPQQAVRVLCLGVDVDAGASPSSALPVLCGVFPSF